MSLKKIETKKSFLYWDERGFVKAECKPKARLELDDAIEFNEARKAISPEKKHLILFDSANVLSVSRENRLYGSSEDSREITIAFATIVTSQIGKVFGNLFMRVNKPPYPVRLFNSEDEAIAWLMKFKEEK